MAYHTNRQRGTLLGLAIADALGAAVEFKSPGSFPEVTGYRGGGPHGLPPGAWTDDTSMALALADSIASVGWDLNDQARRYAAWWRKGEYSVICRNRPELAVIEATLAQSVEGEVRRLGTMSRAIHGSHGRAAV